MGNDETIIQLLTEIRDHLREESTWCNKAIDESVRLQRAGLHRQRVAIVLSLLLLVIGVVTIVSVIVFDGPLFKG